MDAHPCMSIVTGDAGGQGHGQTMTSRGGAGGEQEGRASREQ